MKQRIKPWQLAVGVFLYLLPCLFFAYRLWLWTDYPTDASVFTYIAKAMTMGQLPYRDVFDHKCPVIYWIYYIPYVIFRNPAITMFVLFVVGYGLLMWFVWRLFKQFEIESHWFLLAWLVCLPIFFSHELLVPEFFAAIFLAMTLALPIRYVRGGTAKYSELFWFGIGAGLAFWMKPNVSICWLAPACLMLVMGLKRDKDERQRIVGYIGSCGLGFAVVTAICVGWCLMLGILDDMLSCMSANSGYISLYVPMILSFKYIACIVCLIFGFIIFYPMIRRDKSYLGWYVCLAVEVLVLNMSFVSSTWYFFTLIPLLMIMFGFMCQTGNELAAKRVFMLASVVIWMVFAVGYEYVSGYGRRTVADCYEQAILEIAQPGDTVFLSGNTLQPLLRTGYMCSSKFIYQLVPVKDLCSEIEDDIMSDPPDFIVVLGEKQDGYQFTYPHLWYENLSTMVDFIEENYEKVLDVPYASTNRYVIALRFMGE